MAESLGKKFERVIKEAFEGVDNVSVDRLNDQTNGFAGRANICDFIVYKQPCLYYIECKTVHGNTLSIHSNDPKKKYGNITNNQWEEMLKKSHIYGVHAGVICWWVDHDITAYIPIQVLDELYKNGYKSISYEWDKKVIDDDGEIWGVKQIKVVYGKKKRTFFDYDMERFFEEVE